MPLVLSPITPSDALAWTRIRSLAYAGPTHNLIHSNQPLSESSLRSLAEDRKHELKKRNTWHLKIVDTDLPPCSDDTDGTKSDNNNAVVGRVIAMAVWSLKNVEPVSETASSEPLETQTPPPFTPPNLRLDALESLLMPMRTTQLSVMGVNTPYLMLHSLATHPEHQGRGAASLLLAWGLRKADTEGLSIYLDCTDAGRGLYERRGFELVGERDWDRENWGGEGRDWYGSMVRWVRTVEENS